MYTVNTEPVSDDEEQTQVGRTHFKTPLRGYTYTGRIIIYIISSKKASKLSLALCTLLSLCSGSSLLECVEVIDTVRTVSGTKLIVSETNKESGIITEGTLLVLVWLEQGILSSGVSLAKLGILSGQIFLGDFSDSLIAEKRTSFNSSPVLLPFTVDL